MQQVLVGKLVLRIERRVAAGTDAEALAKGIRVDAEDVPDFLIGPDVERAFHLVRAGIAGVLRRMLSASSAE